MGNPMPMTVKIPMPNDEFQQFRARLYNRGHLPQDFTNRLSPDLIAVAPIPPLGQKGGIITPGAANDPDKATQFCLAHIVVALPYEPFMLWEGTLAERELCVGDIVKCYEQFIDPVDDVSKQCLATVLASKVKAVVFSRAPEAASRPEPDDAGLQEPGTDDEG